MDKEQPKVMTRDQVRAAHAYECVGPIKEKDKKLREEYKNLVHDLGANLLRSGMSVAIATVEREALKRDVAKLLLDHLGRAGIPAIGKVDNSTIGGKVRELELPEYLLASREMLRVVAWLRRAVQALLGDRAAKTEADDAQ